VLGPWLPKNILAAEALGLDRANPLRGRIPATAIPSAWNGTTGGAFDDPRAVRFFAGDPQLAGFSAAQLAGFSIDVLDPEQRTHVVAPDFNGDQRGVARRCERGFVNCQGDSRNLTGAATASCGRASSRRGPAAPGDFAGTTGWRVPPALAATGVVRCSQVPD
jgi:hypothetical protein